MEIIVTWFLASDIPMKDHTPFRGALNKNTQELLGKAPGVWEPFSARDSVLLEETYQKYRQSKSDSIATAVVLPLAHDGLYEANVITREFYPVYWDGQTYELRRGIWFEPSRGM